MKVVQINATCDAGSTGRICRELNDALLQYGNEGLVLYGNGKSDYQHARKVSGNAEVKAHGLLSRILGKNAAYSPAATGKILDTLAAWQPDIVHLHNLHGNYVNLKPLLRYLAANDIPTVLTLHDCWLFTGKCTHYPEAGCHKWQTGCGCCPQLKGDIPSYCFDRTAEMWVEKKALFQAIPRLAVIGVSDWITEEARKSFLKDAAILQQVYNWIDPEVFYPRGPEARREFGISENKYAVLCAGVAWDRGSTKTKDLLALAAILPEDCEIILAGAIAFSGRLPGNIKSVGYLSSAEDLAKLYSACDIYVHLSREDTFGKVIAEAIACGTPAVVYDSTACPEIVGADCGYVVPVGDVASIWEAIQKTRNGERTAWEQSCVQHARDDFSKEKRIAQTLELYQKLLQKEV